MASGCSVFQSIVDRIDLLTTYRLYFATAALVERLARLGSFGASAHSSDRYHVAVQVAKLRRQLSDTEIEHMPSGAELQEREGTENANSPEREYLSRRDARETALARHARLDLSMSHARTATA